MRGTHGPQKNQKGHPRKSLGFFGLGVGLPRWLARPPAPAPRVCLRPSSSVGCLSSPHTLFSSDCPEPMLQ